jgi:hypothetical protein
MRTVTIHCDRCRRVIERQPGVVELRALGALLPALDGRVDLCGACAARLLEWLRSPDPEDPRDDSRPLAS